MRVLTWNRQSAVSFLSRRSSSEDESSLSLLAPNDLHRYGKSRCSHLQGERPHLHKSLACNGAGAGLTASLRINSLGKHSGCDVSSF